MTAAKGRGCPAGPGAPAATHAYDLVFCGAPGAWLQRSAMARRVWRPAVDGTAGTGSILEGMHFTTPATPIRPGSSEDDIPEIAQARRRGHRLPGIRGVYSHVTPVMIARITNGLQARWQAGHAPTPLPQRHLHAA